jgi:hypothetical protein
MEYRRLSGCAIIDWRDPDFYAMRPDCVARSHIEY